MRFFHAIAAAAALTKTASALPSVTRTGRYLYANGQRFFVKGVAYQPEGSIGTGNPVGFPEPTDYSDPLSDSAGCTRDLPYLKQLGVNVVRVYSVNSGFSHDACMQMLSGAGIYVILDLALPVNGSINRVAPSWTINLLDQYLGTIDAFAKYDNMLAYNIGNEIFTGPIDTPAGPYIKAAVRDIKAYLGSKSLSTLVSFSSTDGSGWLRPSADFLGCDSAATSIDLYGLNNYRWCGASSIAAYTSTIGNFSDYPIPAYFSEFGCVTSPPRVWTEVQAIYGDQDFYNVFSGGVAFSYFPAQGPAGFESPGFGLVTISSDNKTVTTSSDFTALQQQYSQVTIPSTPAQSAAGSNTQATCPAMSENWLGSTTLPPTPTDGACSCLRSNYISCEFSNGNSANASPIIGSILNYVCPTLGTLGGSCADIGGNGTSGTYGPFSACDPITQTSYAMSQYYQLTNRSATSCDFQGNGTVVSTGPASATAANTAASSCASQGFTGTTVPAAPPATVANAIGGGAGAQPTSAGSSGSSGSSGSKSGALGSFNGLQSTMAMGATALASVLAGVAIML